MGIQGGGVHPPHERTFFVTLNNPSTPIYHFQVKTTHPFSFGPCSNYSFWIAIRLYRAIFLHFRTTSFLRLETWWDLETFESICPWQTKFIDEIAFPFLMTYLKICLWSISYTPVMLHSQWHYWSSSLHKGYPWHKVPSHTISKMRY